MRPANDNSKHTCHVDDEECIECQRMRHSLRMHDLYIGEFGMNERAERIVHTPAEVEARKRRRTVRSHEAAQAKKRWASIG